MKKTVKYTGKSHVRKGDNIIVLSGKNRGKTGTIVEVQVSKQRVLVDGDAAVYHTKHVRANPQANVEGGRIQKMRPIHISNVALVDPESGKATRVRRERTADGVVRVSKKSGHKFE
ncbi:MAG: 50S ribosomal protein L24 [Planctomycetes bacterium]|nr:50S ribosomal protein L24 [Planctomycetota bacterium]